MSKKSINSFFLIMVISLVGNFCADYALLWYAISFFKNQESSYFSNPVSLFYVGQALGAILLAPIISVLYDRFNRKFASIGLDIFYAGFLVLAFSLYKMQLLHGMALFSLAMVLSALALVHRSSVALAAIKEHPSSTNEDVAKFVAAITFAHMVGAGISGAVYSFVGFTGCMAIGIATFIPAITSYFLVFKNSKAPKSSGNFFSEMGRAAHFLRGNKVILKIALSLGIFNIVGALIPAFLGVSMNETFGVENPWFGVAIAVGLGVGIFCTKKFANFSQGQRVNRVILYSLIPTLGLMFVSSKFDHWLVFLALYIFACMGSAYRNVSTGILRVKLIPKDLIGRINTIYTSILFSGQVIGSFLIIPRLKQDISQGALLACVAIAAAMIFSFIFLPNKLVQEVEEVKS